MEKEELAQLLNGRQYRDEIENDEEMKAEESGLIVIFGASDDLVEFRGVIYDEIGAYGGTKFGIKIGKNSGFPKLCKAKKTENKFDAIWCDGQVDCSWLIKTNIPHATFDIMEHDELFSKGIVIDVKDLK